MTGWVVQQGAFCQLSSLRQQWRRERGGVTRVVVGGGGWAAALVAISNAATCCWSATQFPLLLRLRAASAACWRLCKQQEGRSEVAP